MQYLAPATNTITPQAAIDATVNTFNNQASVGQHRSLLPLEKARLLANDPLYVEVAPYSLYYRLAVMVASSADKEKTKELFGLSDLQIDKIVNRTRASLETGHQDTWNAFNHIEQTAKRDGYLLPEPPQIKTPAPEKKETIIRRDYNPSVVLPPYTNTSSKKTAQNPGERIPRNPTTTISPRQENPSGKIRTRRSPSDDMAKASSGTQDEKPKTEKKRVKVTLPDNITSLTIPRIVEEGIKIYDEMGFGLVSKEDFSNRKNATPKAVQLKQLVAYTAYRALPYSRYSLERIADGAFLTETTIKDTLEKIEKSIGSQHKITTQFLHALGERLELTARQKTLMFLPSKPRFKSWAELQELISKAQPSSPTPEGP